MANKVTVGKTPKTFKEIAVSVVMPDGTDGLIPVVYKYRTKSGFGKWMDESIAHAKSLEPFADTAADTANPDEFSWEKFYEKNTDAAVSQLLDAVDSWGLDIPLTREVLAQLGDEMPAAVSAMLGAYGAACREGRMGN